MTYPYPQQPGQQYPPQGQYPPQQGPLYPHGQYPPQQGYYQQPPQAPAAPQPAPAKGTLDGFFSQPSASGKSLSAFLAPGKSITGYVARPLTDADIQGQTDVHKTPLFFSDGRPKLVMIVPMLVEPSPDFPEGRAAWYVKGQAREELARAMSEAGADGAPEAGAQITIACTGMRSIPNLNAAKVLAVTYRRPDGAPAQAPPAAQQQAPAANGNGQAPQQYAQQPVMPPPPEQPAPATLPGIPEGLTADQAALFTRLTGQQAAPQ